MRKVNHIALLFTLIGAFLCPNPAYSIDADCLRVPLNFEQDDKNDSPSIPSEEKLIHQVRTDSPFKTYVVTDQLFSLLNLGSESNTALAISEKTASEDSVENKEILSLLNKASALRLPGASKLLELYKKGDGCFFKASKVLNPDWIKVEVNSSSWNRTLEEIVMSLLWHERMHLRWEKLARSDPSSFGQIYQLMEFFGLDEDEVIMYITAIIRSKKEVGDFIRSNFTPHLAGIIKNIWKETRPSKEETKRLRNAAINTAPFISEFNYASIVKDMTGARGFIGKILNTKSKKALSFL
ncbi:MAG: hypothetical protein P9L93_02405 [Candidatus Gorgyraea atricola]|nr:hypothetical protein [Candidatus Gorgyraea atricola]